MVVMQGISVIIPVYNREAFLGEAIRSVVDQTFNGSIEIIISDDGSTDQSMDVAASFGDKLRILPKPALWVTHGASGARNRGILASTQPFIAFLDSDDFYLPDHLNRMLQVLERDKALGFAFARSLQMKEQDGVRVYAPWTRPHITARDIKHPVVSGHNVVNTNSFIFRRQVFERAGLFNDSYSNHEDSDLWMRISELYTGAFSKHYGAVYRVSHSTAQLTNSANQARNQQCLSMVFGCALKRYHKLPDKDRYRLFRLRLICAVLSHGCNSHIQLWYALSMVALRHPLCNFVRVVELVERTMTKKAPEGFKPLSEYLA